MLMEKLEIYTTKVIRETMLLTMLSNHYKLLFNRYKLCFFIMELIKNVMSNHL